MKNLENVQGDERDVIFFSTAFSVNDKGVLPLNFGPLIQAGGERRLNVAITRARQQVVIFTSFEPSQLRVDETKNKGLKHLRAYLELADTGTRALERTRSRQPGKDFHRDDVAQALRDRGYVVRTDVGLSDFRVDIAVARPDEPGSPFAAVLLDGPEWGARPTIGDRDALPLEVLGGMLKWPVVSRVWLPTWLADRDKALAELEASFAGVEPPAETQAAEPSVAFGEAGMTRTPSLLSAEDQDETEPAGAAEDVWAGVLGYAADETRGPNADRKRRDVDLVQFEPWDVEMRGGRDVLDALEWSEHARSAVSRVAVEIIDVEQAVHSDRLVKLVASAFDLSRVNANRAQSILAQVPRLHTRGDEPNVLWSASITPASWDVVRVDENAHRPMDHVPLREIANAMADVCARSGGATRAELLREALAHFGLRRLTKGIDARMSTALDYAVRGRILAETDGIYRRAVAWDADPQRVPAHSEAQGLSDQTDDWTADLLDLAIDYTHIVISRQEIESGDTSQVLSTLNVLLGTPEAALRNRERVAMSVYGYETDPRELWDVPEVRDYLHALDDEFPYWFWFLDKTQPFLQVVILCHVDVERVGSGQVRADSAQMQQLMADWWLPKAATISSWAGATGADEDELVNRAALYAAQGPQAFANGD